MLRRWQQRRRQQLGEVPVCRQEAQQGVPAVPSMARAYPPWLLAVPLTGQAQLRRLPAKLLCL